jgi:GT2 family glycosyltransferase
VLGVVVVTYNSATDGLLCLESLFASAASDGVRLQVVVVDNASTDDTPERVAEWAAGRLRVNLPGDLPTGEPVTKPIMLSDGSKTDAPLTLLRSPVNGGFAFGVNLGLAYLLQEPKLDRFWLLNPDSIVPQGTPRAFATYPSPEGFGLMGGRVIYRERPDMIQMDGGVIDRRTGVTHNINQFRDPAVAPPPNPAQIDFISGANLVISRAFHDLAGPMPEGYFLYYEEVEWAMRKGSLPLLYCSRGVIYHTSGGSIGSGSPEREATPFAVYFRYRARMRFVRRYLPSARAGAWAYTLAKAVEAMLRGRKSDAVAMMRGAIDSSPPPSILAMLAPEAAERVLCQDR